VLTKLATIVDTILSHFVAILDRGNTWNYYNTFKSKGALPSESMFRSMIKLYSAVDEIAKVSFEYLTDSLFN
jgi:hypothetical protein